MANWLVMSWVAAWGAVVKTRPSTTTAHRRSLAPSCQRRRHILLLLQALLTRSANVDGLCIPVTRNRDHTKQKTREDGRKGTTYPPEHGRCLVPPSLGRSAGGYVDRLRHNIAPNPA